MIKTRKSIAKKFKVTGTGKVLRRTAGKRHFLRNKTVKQKRRMSQDKSCPPGLAKIVKIGCPNKF
jgi:large subunit ribosomal protein L35